MRLNTDGSCLVELWGVLEDLMYARRLQFWFIELHVDSLIIVKAITSHGHRSYGERSLVEKIHRLLALD